MLETARDQASPRIHQLSFFLPMRVGSLQQVVTALDAKQIRICGLSILDAHDHAVVRMVVDKPGKAVRTLEENGRITCTNLLLGIAVPEREPTVVNRLLGRLLCAELNVHYAYALLVRHKDAPIVALSADDLDSAAEVVRNGGFELVEQNDLELLGGPPP
jgi:hypothetical protein